MKIQSLGAFVVIGTELQELAVPWELNVPLGPYSWLHSHWQ